MQITVPTTPKGKRYKAKLIYRQHIENLEVIPYQPKKIKRVKLLEANHLSYDFKYLDRQDLLQVTKSFSGFDEWIYVRNGLITDSSFSNLAFYDGSKWLTPAKPLLAGTCRARLLDEGILIEATITPKDLPHFQRISFINAMLDLDQTTIRSSELYPID